MSCVVKQSLLSLPLLPAGKIGIHGFHDIQLGAESCIVVGGADERTAGHVAEALGEGYLAQLIEHLGPDIVDDRQMSGRGAQVLAHGEHGHAMLTEVIHGAFNFLAGLTQTEHDTALGHHAAGRHFQRTLQHVQGKAVLGTEAYHGREPLHRLQIVIENMRGGIHDHGQSILISAEVGGEYLEHGLRAQLTDAADDFGNVRCAAIGQVIARHHGDHGVVQVHVSHALGNLTGLLRVERFGLGRAGGAEAAGAGAHITACHERGRAVAPAFATVRTHGFLAHSHQAVILDEVLHLFEHPALRQLHFQPGWLAHALILFL